jgi:raffinose/stachyose/melibiose transport system substrate-binding protein
MVHARPAQRCAAMVCTAAAVLAGTGCAPGGSSKPATPASSDKPVVTDVAQLGKVTITEWDKNTFVGPNKAMQQINAAFARKYPNIKVHRVARAFEDLKTTLKLSLSSGSPPDVVQVNQGYGDLVAFTKAGLIRPVDNYARAYGWIGHYPKDLLAQNRVSPDGTWGQGNLYGISNTAELVGVYYNKGLLAKLGVKPPASFPEFAADLAKAKAAGMLPLQFGASSKAPDIHLFGLMLAGLAGSQTVDDLVFGRSGASWKDPNVIKTLQTLSNWSKQGWIPSDANGKTEAQAGADFQKGKGAFYISGSWWGGTFDATPNVGFTALGPQAGSEPVTMGGLSLLWAITSKSRHADAAAAYINFVNSPEAADIIARTGDLPANQGGTFKAPAGSLESQLGTSIGRVLQSGAMVPYLDYSTPDFYNVITAQLQQLTAGRTSPGDAASALQKEADTFKSTSR